MPRIYLTTTYAERQEAKSLGARWDGDARKWFVESDSDLSPFSRWLPSDLTDQAPALIPAAPVQPALRQASYLTAPGSELTAPIKGVSLTELLNGVKRAVEIAYQQGVWTRVEVIKSTVRGGHVYLELTERDARGQSMATARGMIWSSVANKVLPAFESATGMVIGPGMKLLVQAKPSFSAQYGLSLEISNIDPSFSLGDLEAKKREIIARLTREDLLDRNKKLPPPWDFMAILVIAPEQAAGLGDFKAESDRLQACGLCTFTFESAVFQGEGAPAQIAAALKRGMSTGIAFDAVVIIRGGGAVNDLAWLNDYGLAKVICECPVPVITGIGHERDRTVLDDVAHISYDTPSKVILGIESSIKHIWLTAKANFAFISQQSGKACATSRLRAVKINDGVRNQALATITAAKQQSQRNLDAVRTGATKAVNDARIQSQAASNQIQSRVQATIASAKERTPATLQRILDQTANRVRVTRERAAKQLDEVAHNATRIIHSAREQSDAFMREIVGQGPEKTLKRGFAVLRDADTGQPITSAIDLKPESLISIQMHDGSKQARTIDNKTI